MFWVFILWLTPLFKIRMAILHFFGLHIRVILILLNIWGTRGHILTSKACFPFSICFNSFIFFIFLDQNGDSALIVAALKGYSDIVKYLGDKKAKLDIKSLFYILL